MRLRSPLRTRRAEYLGLELGSPLVHRTPRSRAIPLARRRGLIGVSMAVDY